MDAGGSQPEHRGSPGAHSGTRHVPRHLLGPPHQGSQLLAVGTRGVACGPQGQLLVADAEDGDIKVYQSHLELD